MIDPRKSKLVGMIPRGSTEDLVDAFVDLDQVAHGVLDRESANLESSDERSEWPNLVTRKPVYIPDSNTPRLCVASVQAYALVEKVC